MYPLDSRYAKNLLTLETLSFRIVVHAEARQFLDEFGIAYTEYEGVLYVADSIESVCRTCASAIGAGAKVFNLMSVEDVMIREACLRRCLTCGHSATNLCIDRGGVFFDTCTTNYNASLETYLTAEELPAPDVTALPWSVSIEQTR
jgi:hypothetical protein